MNILGKNTPEEKISLYNKQIEVLLSDIQKLEVQKLRSISDGQMVVRNAVKEANSIKKEAEKIKKEASSSEKYIEDENKKLLKREEKLAENTQNIVRND